MLNALDTLILAVPKGRILKELHPLLKACGIEPEPDFSDKNTRKLRFKTNHEALDIIRVRSFDVPTFVAHGGAHFGVAGSDVLEEFDYDGLYSPLDLGIGHCRLSLAVPEAINKEQDRHESHIRVCTKYPNVTARHFARQGIQAECIKLNGAMEIAPALGLSTYIVDLVSTGRTLKANALRETETILDISSRLIVNRNALKTRPALNDWVGTFRAAVEGP